MRKKLSIRKLTDSEIADIDGYIPMALRLAEKVFPGNSIQDQEDRAILYIRLMDDEMIRRGLRVKIP